MGTVIHERMSSLIVLGTAFVAVVATVLALTGLIVPGRTGSAQNPDGASPGASTAPSAAPGSITGIGGTLTVTGDREGTLVIDSEGVDNRYSVLGDDGRISFEGDPMTVVQLSYEGWEFFPEPEDCTLTPGELDVDLGVVATEFRCDDLADVRDKGTISLSGVIGLPADVVGMSPDLPDSGGSAQVGEEAWEFEEVMLFAWQFPSQSGGNYNMNLIDDEAGMLGFNFDVQSHQLTLARVERDGTGADVSSGACSINVSELGRYNPRTTVIEVTFTCTDVEVPGLGAVPISGTVIADRIEVSF